VVALLSGCLGLVLPIVVLVIPGLSVAAPLTLLALTLGAGVSVVFAVTANKPPSPLAWRVAMIYCALPPVVTVLSAFRGERSLEPFSALPVLVSGLWLLYFARRRSMYGLPPWPGIM
jgi:hypothetical protein